MEVSMCTPITSAWNEIINQFFCIFTVPTAQIFSALVSGWVLCTGRRTVTGILPFAACFLRRPHDAFHRFFNNARWHLPLVWQTLTLLLVKVLCPTGLINLDVDDTLFRRAGKHVQGASRWRDPVLSGLFTAFSRGLNLVVVTLRVNPPWGGEPIGLPINMRLRLKKGLSHIELALQMLGEIESWLPGRQFICHCDGFYTALIRRKPERMEIISHMRKDAVIFDLPEPEVKPRRGRPRVRGYALPKPPVLAQTVRKWKSTVIAERTHKTTMLLFSKPIIWYHVSKQPLLLVISRDPSGKRPDDFFVSTDPKMKPEEVISGFSGRWSIEDTFKNTKQLLGGQQIQCFKRQGPERAAAMSFWLYSTVWLWYLKNKKTRGKLPKLPWYRKKTNPSFADALACLRQQIWRERINCMFDSHIAFEKIPIIIVNALAYAA
jgi:hypothetical protein